MLPIPPVLDEIVAAIVVKLSGYLSPSRALGRDVIHDEIRFVRCHGGIVQTRFEVLVPALSTLFGTTATDSVRDCNPVRLIFVANGFPEEIVLKL